MKIYNLSYNDPERFEEVYRIIGKPYGFFKSIALGGTGSPPLTLKSAPAEVMAIANQTRDKVYCNIEMCPKGIIFRFRSRLENYGIPFLYSDIEKIELPGFSNKLRNESGVITISVKEHQPEADVDFTFDVKSHEMKKLSKFFSRREFGIGATS